MRSDGTGLCYNTPKVLNTYKAIEDIKDYLPEDAGTINSQNTKELFFKEQAVMMFGGSWDLQKVKEKAVEFEWSVFAVPAPVFHTTYVIFQPDIAVGMNNATQHPAEARLFLEWLMTEEAVNLTAQNLPGFYPLNNIQSMQGNDADDEKFVKLVNEYDSDIRWLYTEINNKYPSASAIVRRGLYDMVTFDLPAVEAARRLQTGLGEWYEPAQTCSR
jgi:raffinose/stachyose/melibiose transport system substrate-binding protein